MIQNIPRSLVVKLGWTTVTHAIVQGLRLVNNVVLAHLLAPALFGLMVIVNTVRIGVELLSDVGVGQNIVSNKDGAKPEFYDTAWTLQVMRGLVLGTLFFLFTRTIADAFDQPALIEILPVVALLFVFQGFESAGRPLLQKRMELERLSLFELAGAAFSLIAHVILALITPTIWALVLGSVISAAATLVLSYFLIPGLRHRFLLNRPSVRQILHFGKWIFLSSILYFAAANFDRLYFATTITLADLGVYGIARALSDMALHLAIRCSNMLVFPAVAAMSVPAPEIRKRILHGRRTLLFTTAVAMGLLVALADALVSLLYDPRYAAAGQILPILLLGSWFAILATVNDSIMTGIARPGAGAVGNAAKLISYVVGVPLAMYHYGFYAAVAVLSAGEVVRYVVLWLASRRQALAFARDDLALTAIFVLVIVAGREFLWFIGLTEDLQTIFPIIGNLQL